MMAKYDDQLMELNIPNHNFVDILINFIETFYWLKWTITLYHQILPSPMQKRYRLDRVNMSYAKQYERFLVCNYLSQNRMNLMEDLFDYDDINYPWFPKKKISKMNQLKYSYRNKTF